MPDGAMPDDALGQIAASYDDLPYISKPFPKTHPARIGAIARLLGLPAAPAETARVLEIGCASGGNIIPQAFYHPGARFLGVDLGVKQIAEGQAKIAGLGLTNIELRCQSVTELDEAEGQFDYIVAHGIYSWVPEFVSDAILRICRALLAPGGVIMISYNVLPGWRLLQPARDAFAALIPADLPPQVRVDQARDLLAALDCNPDDPSLYASVFRAVTQRLAGLSDDHFFHEFMENANRPVTFDHFVDQAEAHRLAYLGDAEFSTMFPQNYPQPYADMLASQAGGNLLKAEQLNDILSGRTFRHSLLIGRETLPNVQRALDPGRLAGLYVSGNTLRLERDAASIKLVNAEGRELRSTSKAVGKAAERLVAALPAPIACDELVGDESGDDRAAIADALLKLVIAGMLSASTNPMAAGKLPKRPVANRLAQWDCAAGHSATVNPRHEFAVIEPISRLLLPLLDGSRDQYELATALGDEVERSGLQITENGALVESVRDARRVIRKNMPELLRGLELSGLLGH